MVLPWGGQRVTPGAPQSGILNFVIHDRFKGFTGGVIHALSDLQLSQSKFDRIGLQRLGHGFQHIGCIAGLAGGLEYIGCYERQIRS